MDVLAEGRRVGVMGRVKPALAEDFHARKPVWLAELNLELLRELYDKAVVRFTPCRVYPPVRRDITVMAGPELKVSQVLDHLAGSSCPCWKKPYWWTALNPSAMGTRNRPAT